MSIFRSGDCSIQRSVVFTLNCNLTPSSEKIIITPISVALVANKATLQRYVTPSPKPPPRLMPLLSKRNQIHHQTQSCTCLHLALAPIMLHHYKLMNSQFPWKLTLVLRYQLCLSKSSFLTAVISRPTRMTIPIIGETKVQVQYSHQSAQLPLVVASRCCLSLLPLVVASIQQSLMGQNWLQHIKPDWKQIAQVSNFKPSNPETLIHNHPQLFDSGLVNLFWREGKDPSSTRECTKISQATPSTLYH